MSETSTSRRFEPVTALLFAVMVAGTFNAVGAMASVLTLPSTISSLDEFGATDATRRAAYSDLLWIQLPFLVAGVVLAGVGLLALRRTGRLKGVRWPTVVGGIALSIPVSWAVLILGVGLHRLFADPVVGI